MIRCAVCGEDNLPGSRFCRECATSFEVTLRNSGIPEETSLSGADPGTVVTPPESELKLAKSRLFDRPLISDWTFWVFVLFAAVGGTRFLYGVGSGYRGLDPAVGTYAALLDVAFNIAGGFLVFAVIPAAIRLIVRRMRDKRVFAGVPSDRHPGWKTDPVNEKRLRWWNGDQWMRATDPPEPSSVGLWSWIVVAGLVVASFGAVVLGIYDSQSRNEQPRAIGQIIGQSDRSHSDSETSNITGDLTDEGDPGRNVLTHFSALSTSLPAYSRRQINTEDYGRSILAARAALQDVQETHFQLKSALSKVTRQQDLGNPAPDLGSIRTAVDVVESFIKTENLFYSDLQTSRPMTARREWSQCDAEIFQYWSDERAAGIDAARGAFRAVIDSYPSNP